MFRLEPAPIDIYGIFSRDNEMNNYFKLPFLAVFCVFFQIISNTCDAASSPKLVAPPYNVIDRHSVNVMTGQVQMTHLDVKIGGDVGLSHSISMNTSSWVGPDSNPTGPLDQYAGRLIAVKRNAYTGDSRYWLVASDGGASQYFDPGSGLAAIPDANGYFPPINDKRYSLRYESSENGLVMTEPDGTKVIYGSSQIFSNMEMGTTYGVTEIRKPTGFSIKIKYYTDGRPASVVSNTGFQLRYYYVQKSSSVDPSAWWALNPEYVVGINNAIQYCPNSAGAQLNQSDCAVSGWPTVHYIWPNNMPMSMETADGVFSVVDPGGARTDYFHKHYHLQNAAYPDVARVSGVKPGRATEKTLNYSYINVGGANEIHGIAGYYAGREIGLLEKSWNGDDITNYTPAYQTSQGLYMSSSGYQNITTYTNASSDSSGGKPVRIDAWNYQAIFNLDGTIKSYSDNLQQFSNQYYYDDRFNVTKLVSRGITLEAEYETSCNSSNYKYCNSPKWVSDGKGNRVYYTYHANSGQIESVTYPADKNNKVAQIRYEYMQKSALYYLDASGVKKPGMPIWVKTAEKSCANSNFNGVCAGNDELVTRYEYNDNLQVKGITVTADGKTLRTCFKYDKYGYQISKTEPNANLSGCN